MTVIITVASSYKAVRISYNSVTGGYKYKRIINNNPNVTNPSFFFSLTNSSAL